MTSVIGRAATARFRVTVFTLMRKVYQTATSAVNLPDSSDVAAAWDETSVWE